MKKIKKISVPKISLTIPKENREHISFSTEYLTTNKGYNFNYFSNGQMRDKLRAYNAFWELIGLWSNKSIQDISVLRRTIDGGFKKIPINSLRFSPNKYLVQDLTYVYSVRFCNTEYRLIGFFKEKSAVFYVIGFDFAHNAYNHGS